jgi:hypothetical protein
MGLTPLKETIGVKLDNLYRRMDIDVQQTFKQLDLRPINVLQTDRNMGLGSGKYVFNFITPPGSQNFSGF